MKKKFSPKALLYSLIILFFIIVAYFIAQSFFDVSRPFFFVLAALGIIFMFFGGALVFLARKEKGALRIFLMITGISAICPFVFSILHNVFYALGIIFENSSLLFEILHAGSFIIALIISPIIFFVGAIASIILLKRK